MAKIRIVRIMEYVYDDAEKMIEDMPNWTVPANGSRRFNSREVVRSCTMPPEMLPHWWNPEEPS